MLYHSRLRHMLIILVIKLFFLLHFLFFCIIHVLLHLLPVSSFIKMNFLFQVFFLSLVKKSYLSLLIKSLLYPHFLLGQSFLISSSLIYYITCFLSSLLNLLECSILFLLEQTDSVG